MTDTELPITTADVEAAGRRLAGIVNRTPLIENATLNERVGGRLLVKAEMLQVTGSFKYRGASNAIANLPPERRKRGVVAFSSGNHAQGVAAAARHFGIPALIVMPDDAPAIKRAGTEAWGAEIVTYDRQGGESREEKAAMLAEHRGLTLIRPYDDPHVMAGQGTAGLEIADQAASLGVALDAVLVPCGGGGLTAGIATAVRHDNPATVIHTVEPTGFDDTARSLASGERRRNTGPEQGLCDALLAPQPGELTFAVNRQLCGPGLAVDDQEVLAAMYVAFRHLKLVAEPGGAVALAAALSGKIELRGKTVCVVMSGGNVDPAVYRNMLEQQRSQT